MSELASSVTVERVSSIDEVNENQWNHVVEQADQGSVFHRSEWIRAVERRHEYDPQHLIVSKKDNPIAVFPNVITDHEVLPIRRLTSTNPGSEGPAIMADEESTMAVLLESAPSLCTGTVALHQLTSLDPSYARYHEILGEYGYQIRLQDCDLVLDLCRGWDAILAGMDSGRRRAITRDTDHEYTIVDESLSSELLSVFYDDYLRVITRVDAPQLPRTFFSQLWTFPDRIKVFSVRIAGNRAGMLLFVLDDERATVHYVFSAVTEDHFQYNSSELLHAHAIQWAIDNGYELYNFGGSTPDFRNGLFRFKEQFGGRLVPKCTWERGYPPQVLSGLKAARSVHDRSKSVRSLLER